MRRLLLGALAAACAFSAHAGLFDDDQARAKINTLGSRLDDVSQRVDAVTSSQVEFNNQVESIKADIAKLRGQIDELNYNLDSAQKRQKDFYVDLDNRLRKLEPQGQGETAQADGKEDAAKSAEAAAKSAEATAMRNYEAALTALKASDFKTAASGFEAVIKGAPNSPQLPGAYFFSGYCYSHLKQPIKAAEMYRTVSDKWPDDEHAPDAMLARAGIMEQAGQRKEARAVLVDLLARYPSSDAAKQAKAKLIKK
jgi:tol-pal system protein YbgF